MVLFYYFPIHSCFHIVKLKLIKATEIFSNSFWFLLLVFVLFFLILYQFSHYIFLKPTLLIQLQCFQISPFKTSKYFLFQIVNWSIQERCLVTPLLLFKTIFSNPKIFWWNAANNKFRPEAPQFWWDEALAVLNLISINVILCAIFNILINYVIN